MKTSVHFLSCFAHFFVEGEMFRTKVVEKIKTHFVFDNSYSKIVPFMRYVEKYCIAGRATHGNTAHAHCMLAN